MHTPAETTTVKQTISSAESVQEKRDGLSGIALTDNRPETNAQRKLQELANNCTQVKQLKTLQEMVNANNKKIIQRAVVQIPTTPYRPGMGKWYSTHDPSKLFDTKGEAEAYDHEIDPQIVEQRIEDECLIIDDAVMRHFNDGWGELYGITTQDQLVTRIKPIFQENEPIGSEYSIPLGTYSNEKTFEVNVACNIVYKVLGKKTYKPGGNDKEVLVRKVFHCGPSTRANATGGGRSTAANGGGGGASASALAGSNQSATTANGGGGGASASALAGSNQSATPTAKPEYGSEIEKKLFPGLPGSK